MTDIGQNNFSVCTIILVGICIWHFDYIDSAARKDSTQQV